MADRFRRPKDKEDIFKRLVSADDAPFMTFKDLFIVAACIGYTKQKKINLPTGGEQIHWSVFKQGTDQVMINAIALCENEDFNILRETVGATDAKFALIEQYASAGLDELKTVLIDSPGDPLDNLVELIFQQEANTEIKSRSFLDEIDIQF